LSAQAEVNALLERSGDGDRWVPLARAVTIVENAPPWEVSFPEPERPAHVVGITGPPGAGKSTLTARLIESYADAGARVAVLAVDPSSPISGGAVLGDRVRMEAALDGRPDMFVRSLASRGSHGALAASTRNVARLLEAWGSFDVVIVETVGAGQTEVAVARLADTVVLVTVPGLGDAVQAIKAGLMEVAELIVVNMADRPGAAETVRHLRLTIGRHMPVLQTVATDGTGVAELREALQGRWTEALETGMLMEQRAAKEAAEATIVAEAWVRACADGAGGAGSAPLKQAVKSLLEEAARTWQG
jgi:LAO/AO transport system kinase